MLFTDGQLSKKHPSGPFPSSVMKWNYELRDQMVPLVVTVWPGDEDDDGLTEYVVEYKVGGESPPLRDVVISIPCGFRPQNVQCDGQTRYRRQYIVWEIGNTGDKRKGTLEFKAVSSEPEDLFPMDIRFASNELFSGLSISSVQIVVEDEHAHGHEEVEFSTEIQCGVTSYEIVA